MYGNQKNKVMSIKKTIRESLLEVESKKKTLLNSIRAMYQFQGAISEKDQTLESTTAHLSEVESELETLKPPDIGAGGFTSEERITCPMCGAVGHDIKTVEDKGKVLSYVGHIPMYAKKNVCKKCGYEF